jgi:antitoxin MazE
MMLDVLVDDGVVKLVPEPGRGGSDCPPAGMPEPFPVTMEWMIAEAERLGGLENAPKDDWDWGPDVGSEIIHDDYNPRPKAR